MVALMVLETVVIALLAVLVAGLLRSHAEILRKLHDLGIGDEEPVSRLRPKKSATRARPASTPAYDLVGATPSGGAAAIGVVGASHPTLLAFLSTGCLTCDDFWRAFAAEEGLSLPGRDTRLVIVTKGLEEESESRLRRLAPQHLPTVLSSQAWADYRVPVSPYFILVDGPSGRVVGEGAAATWPQVSSLLEQAMADADLAAERSPALDTADREARADRELFRAGIHPGHASLYPVGPPEQDR
ncbi:MAG: hypothetical protein ACRDXD_09765 [Acidimicrobiia bacterium]